MAQVAPFTSTNVTPESVAQILFAEYYERTMGDSNLSASHSWFDDFRQQLYLEFKLRGYAPMKAEYVLRTLTFNQFCWELMRVEGVTIRSSESSIATA